MAQPSERAGQPAAATRQGTTRPPTPRQVATPYLQHWGKRASSQQVYLDRLRQADEAIATAYALPQDFAAMLSERRGERLDAWLAEAEGSPVPALRRFATGLRADLGPCAPAHRDLVERPDGGLRPQA